MKPTLEQRFWAKVNKDGPIPAHRPELGPCWEWTACTEVQGFGLLSYGIFNVEGKNKKAHRVAWFFATGSWPKPQALHICDNPKCVRFSHLYEGTQRDNIRECHAKGRDQDNRGEASPVAKLTESNVREIKRLRGILSQSVLAKQYNVSPTAIQHIMDGRNWKHITKPTGGYHGKAKSNTQDVRGSRRVSGRT